MRQSGDSAASVAATSSLRAVLNGRRIVVTGAAGLIGTAVARLAVKVGCQVIPAYHLAAPTADVARDAFACIRGNASDLSFWQSIVEAKPDAILHLAAQTSVQEAESDPLRDYAVNVLPVLLLTKACRSAGWNPAILLAGTSTVHGLPAQIPVAADAPLAPLTVYDLHKLAAELGLRQAIATAGLRGGVLRLCNVYGPGPSTKADRGILDKMIRRALSGQTITLYKPGTMIRDYIYVDDVARAFLVAAANPETLDGRAWVIGAGTGYTVGEAFRMIIKVVRETTGHVADLVEVDAPQAVPVIEQRDFVADVSAFTNATGWRPEVDLNAGIVRTVRAIIEASS